MKKLFLFAALAAQLSTFSQKHFAGLSTSSRVGIIGADLNPAELANMHHKFEINGFGTGISAANNKISIKDLGGDTNLEDKLFDGTAPVNASFNAVVLGPGFAIKVLNWAFAISS